MPASEPCRSVIMTLNALKVPYTLKEINLSAGEQLKPEFVAINPQHCIPTIVDTETNFALWESRAIMTYLVNKFAPGSSLYPTEPQARANVDRLLYFDIGTLYKALGEYVYPYLFYGAPELDQEKDKVLREKLELLNGFLAGNKYVAGGDELTVADLALYSSVTFLPVIDYDLSAFNNVTSWLNRLTADIPDAESINAKTVQDLKVAIAASKAAAAN